MVDMRTAEKASFLSPSVASLVAFHDGDGVVYVTDGAESDDRPSFGFGVEGGREGMGQLQSLRRSNSKPMWWFVRCPKDETAMASPDERGLSRGSGDVYSST